MPHKTSRSGSVKTKPTTSIQDRKDCTSIAAAKRDVNVSGGVRETKAHAPPSLPEDTLLPPTAAPSAPPVPDKAESRAFDPREDNNPNRKHGTGSVTASAMKKKNARSDLSVKVSGFSAPILDWLSTGFLLQAAGASTVLNKFLTDLSKEYFGQILLQVQRQDAKGLREVLMQHAQEPRATALGVGMSATENNSGIKSKLVKSKDKITKRNGNETEQVGLTGPSSVLGPVALSWENTTLSRLKHPVKGAWEAAKVYGPPLGPTPLALSGQATPETSDPDLKLAVLTKYKAFSPVLDPSLTATAAATAQEWVESTTWMKKDGGGRFDKALDNLSALLSGMAAVYPSVRAALPTALEGLQKVQEVRNSLSSGEEGKGMGKEEVEGLIRWRVRRLLCQAWAGRKAKEKGEVLAAENALTALQTAMDAEDVQVGDFVRACRKEEETKIETADTKGQGGNDTEGVVDGRGELSERAVRNKEEEVEERTSMSAAESMSEQRAWEAHLKHHSGLSQAVASRIAAFRQWLQDGKAQDVIRDVLLLLRQHQHKETCLLPVDVHVLQENLGKAALVVGNPTLALSALDKAGKVGVCTEGDNPTLPPCVEYCPVALRLKALALEVKGEEEATKREGSAAEKTEDEPHATELALDVLGDLRKEDIERNDSVRRASYLTSAAVHTYHRLKRLSNGEGGQGEAPEKTRVVVERGLGLLEQARGMFDADRNEEGTEGGRWVSLVDPKWVSLSQDGDAMLWIQTNRLLAIFYAEPCLAPSLPHHHDLSIAAYQAALLPATRLLDGTLEAHSMVHTLRFELARAYARRGKNEQDEATCLALLREAEAALLPSQREEMGRLLHYTGRLLEEKGRKKVEDENEGGGEKELREAIELFGRAVEAFEGVRAKPKGEEERLNYMIGLNKSMAGIYVTLMKSMDKGCEGRSDGTEAGKEGGKDKNGQQQLSGKPSLFPCSPSLSPPKQAIWNADLEKAINRYTNAYTLLSAVAGGGGKASFEAGQVAFAIGDLYLQRRKEKRARNVENAIAWFEKAERDIRRSAPDRKDASGRYLPLYTQLYGKLAGLWHERAGLRKKEGGGSSGKVKEDLRKGEAYGVLFTNARRNYELRADVLAGRMADGLRVEEEGKDRGKEER